MTCYATRFQRSNRRKLAAPMNCNEGTRWPQAREALARKTHRRHEITEPLRALADGALSCLGRKLESPAWLTGKITIVKERAGIPKPKAGYRSKQHTPTTEIIYAQQSNQRKRHNVKLRGSPASGRVPLECKVRFAVLFAQPSALEIS